MGVDMRATAPAEHVSSATTGLTDAAVFPDCAAPWLQNGAEGKRSKCITGGSSSLGAAAADAVAPGMAALRARLQQSLAQSLDIRAAALDRMRAINDRVERLRRIESEAAATRDTLAHATGGGSVAAEAENFRGECTAAFAAAPTVAALLPKRFVEGEVRETPRVVRRLSGAWSRPSAAARGILAIAESEGSVTGSTCAGGERQSAQSRRRLAYGVVCTVVQG
ncbi:unnamed protein product [Closterium sp. NIES-53]